MDLKDLYPAIEAASLEISPICEPVIEKKCDELGLSRQETFILIAVPTFEPEPVSVKLLNVRSPYTSPDHYRKLLDNLSVKGMLQPVGLEGYRLTQRGLEGIKIFLEIPVTLH